VFVDCFIDVNGLVNVTSISDVSVFFALCVYALKSCGDFNNVRPAVLSIKFIILGGP